MKNNIEEIKQKILPILHRYGTQKAGLFGSCVRGKMRKDSDIDILVEIPKDISLLDFVGIKLEMEDALEKTVDLVEYSTIKPIISDEILKEEVKILWKGT